LDCQVVEISQSLRALFFAEVGEDRNAGHGLGRRYRFVQARIVFESVIIIASDDDRFVRPALADGCRDRKKIP
jgi:hypothetical protein